MKDYFYDLVAQMELMLPRDFSFTASFSGENSDFVRFNNAKVRQAGSVVQNNFQADIICGKRHALVSLMLSGRLGEDKDALLQLIKGAQSRVTEVEDDPFLLCSSEVVNSETIAIAGLPDATQITRDILNATKGLEFVGIHAQGLTHRGFANSFGQRNFITQETFNTDFSVYLSNDKAIKSGVAGKTWDTQKFESEIETIKSRLPVLSKPSKTIAKGGYRAYLAPAAVNEIFALLRYGGFSEKQGRTKQSPLMLLRESKRSLHSSVSLSENTEGGISAPFQSGGYLRPDELPLVTQGQWASGLISPRTAKEYELNTNGANSSESPESLDMAAGTLEKSKILSSLHTGLVINNLWYLNYSDRPNCKMTGMTRFATFWVENGEIVAPVNVMRFDDSIYRLLGSSLEAITKDRELILDQSTYEERSTQSAHLPGVLVDEIAFTL